MNKFNNIIIQYLFKKKNMVISVLLLAAALLRSSSATGYPRSELTKLSLSIIAIYLGG